MTAAGGSGLITALVVGDTFTDLGASAIDYLGHDISSLVVVSWPINQQGTINTSQPTADGSPYILHYDVTDATGGRALQAERQIVVGCPQGDQPCQSSVHGGANVTVCLSPIACQASTALSQAAGQCLSVHGCHGL